MSKHEKNLDRGYLYTGVSLIFIAFGILGIATTSSEGAKVLGVVLCGICAIGLVYGLCLIITARSAIERKNNNQ